MPTAERAIKPNYPNILSVKGFNDSGINSNTLKNLLVKIDKLFLYNSWLNFHSQSEFKKTEAAIRHGDEKYNKDEFKKLWKALIVLDGEIADSLSKGLDNKEKYLERMANVVDDFVQLFKKMKPHLDAGKNPQAVFKMVKELQKEIAKNAKPGAKPKAEAEV
ncbi:MAG TPA: hypothetical protein HPQ04_16300 [Rhodospirillaceae bacterium]|nr:hypothetical protein [Rhodospirillaceae bacterium]